MLAAAKRFAIETSVGWDGIHPRSLARVSEELVEWLVFILVHAEKTGEWHRQSIW